MTNPISVKFTDERIADLICCAIEGGIGYWSTLTSREPVGEWMTTYLAIAKGEGKIILRELDNNGEIDESVPERVLDRAAVDRGLQLMADKYPRHFADFVKENEDADTADVFAQCALLGEIVYG